ncbi:MAG: hypothetical protein HY718_03385, partial [Planctomycetes bacterium]|nr:hypothetical protein [Planctomycetota bacterium]
MLILRMRQAETALKDGRLDEAFDLARAADVRMHRRGQDLIGRLARALVGRGREHLTAGRLPLASTDCDKAAALAGNLAEVAELKSAVAEAAAAKQERDRRHAGAIGAARQRIHDGELSIGQRCLEGIDGTMRVDVLQGEAVARRQEAETLLARGEDALQREDWAGAVEALAKARELHSANSSLTDLIARACTGIAACVRLALNQGRLDQASHLLDVAAPLCGRSVEFAELHGAYEMCVKSAGVVARGECRRAIEVLQRLRTVLPDAAWIAEA